MTVYQLPYNKMLLDCVLTSCNEDPIYLGFLPLFIKTWKKLYPRVDVKIVLIAKSIPEDYKMYEENIIIFEPLPHLCTGFTSQYIRLLYPALLDYKHGILITDVDMLPMNRTYFTNTIEKYPDDCFIYLRHVLLNVKECAMCYNIALNKTWSEIFSISCREDIQQRLLEKLPHIQWNTDQRDLYDHVMNWNTRTNRFIVLKDTETGYRRLDRSQHFQIHPLMRTNIQNGLYSDYHCYRPYSEYKDVNEKIYELLQ